MEAPSLLAEVGELLVDQAPGRPRRAAGRCVRSGGVALKAPSLPIPTLRASLI